MNLYVLSLNDSQATLDVVGGKGASLARLANAGLPVPGGFHVTTEAYKQFVAENDLQSRILAALQDIDVAQPSTLETASAYIRALFTRFPIPPAIADEIHAAYLTLPDPKSKIQNPKLPVAVRSSATAEDLPEASFAGQQDTYLNIQGVDAVLDAVRRCWASLWTARAIGYRARQGIDPDTVSLAVVVQALVFAEAAGIMFTANPLNGRRNEVLINAAWGLGEAIVGGLVTPDTYTVDKRTGQVVAREIADKQVMTVRTESGTEEQPVPDTRRTVQVLDDAQIAELARLGVQIEALYRTPMDIEWCLADGQLYIVQARPITALPELEVESPTEWRMPDPKSKYVRASIIDLMPDPVSPLFTTMAFKAYDAGLTRAMSDITRSTALLPEHFLTINDYVYSDTRLNGRQTWWLLTRMLPSFPRMIRTGVSYWRENGRPPYVDTVRRWEGQPLATLSATDLLDGAREIVRAAMFNLTAQMVWMGACAGSEMLFTRVYNRLVKRTGEPDAIAFLMGYDSTPIRAEKSLYDLAAWCGGREALATHLLHVSSELLAMQLESDQIPIDVAVEDWQTFRERFRAHVLQFGHIIYNLDFSKPLPLDDPAPMLETLKLYLRGEGTNPHARQGSLEARRVQATEAALSRVRGLIGWAFRKALHWAQSLAEVREDAFADIGLGYPALRRVLRELGGRLVDARTIEHADDIFWLRLEELEQAIAMLEQETALPGLVVRIGERRAFSRAAGRVTPPPVLPTSAKKVMGVKVEGMVAVGEGSHTDNTIKGAGTSAGQVTAPACVLHGPEDFGQMQPGCILVASLTTPAWTPLFAMAAGVVTDIGGPLSHGSIVAREYGIPAVMGTGVATRRIQNGQTITVNGGTGEVVLHKSETTPVPSAIEWTLPNPKGQYMHASIADLMPNPVSPLFETLAIPTIARVGVKEVLRPLTRSEPILPDYIVTLNSYVYINASYTLREWWWILTRMILSMPRMLREAIPLWRDKIRPQYVAAVARWQDRVPETLPFDELWAGIHELNDAAMLHFSSLLVATTGASAGAEMLFTRVYSKLIRRRDDDPEATVFLMGYDSTPIQAEKSLYDLAEWVRAQPDLAEYLLNTPSADLVTHLLPTPYSILPDWPIFCARLRNHLDTYGHLIYDLDFAKLLPVDDPAPMLETVKMYLRGEGTNPHERQQAAAERREQAVASTRARLKGLRRWAFDKTLKMGQSMAQVRENALADIGLGYPLLRALLHELGRRFVEVGTIQENGDIFWLQADEVQSAVIALERGESLAHLMESVEQRKARHAAFARVTPPPMLPPRKKYMGIDMESFTPAAEGSQGDGVLKGIGASAGQITAPACVLHGPEDFDQMQPGCVLVAGTTTPAWTPLFAMASAVVTDVGGPLSHGSIVAREYGIPAVMGTGVATRRIHNGQTITVDGGAGTVTLLAG